jgi:hypothetical protein
MGTGLGAQHQQHLDEQVGQLVAQDPGQLHPVLVGHLVALDARAGVVAPRSVASETISPSSSTVSNRPVRAKASMRLHFSEK